MSVYDAGDGVIRFTAGADIVKDELVPVGANLMGVALTNIANGAVGSVDCKPGRVYELARVTGASTGWAVGAKLYREGTAKTLTKTATSNQFVGVALKAAVDGDTTGLVMLNVVNPDIA